MINDDEHLFKCLLAICVSFLEKCLFRSCTILYFFFFFDVGYLSCLCIFSINLLAVVSFANIFSHLLCCLFILLMVSFAAQKLFKFS